MNYRFAKNRYKGARALAFVLAFALALSGIFVPAKVSHAQTPNLDVYTNLVLFADFTDTADHDHGENSLGACFAGEKGAEKTFELFNGTDLEGNLVNKRGLSPYIDTVSYGASRVENLFPQYNEQTGRIESYQLPNTAAYYKERPQELLYELMTRLNADEHGRAVIGTAQLSHHNAGYIDNVMIVVGRSLTSGSEDPFGGMTYNTGAGSFTNSAGETYHAGSFNIVTESGAYIGLSGSGLLIHEFMHSMGCPDLYCDSDGTGIARLPVGRWDIMSTETERVQYPLAYMRQHIFGWLSLPTVTENQTGYTLTAASATTAENKNTQAVILKTPYSDKEVFVVEYRKKALSYSESYANKVPYDAQAYDMQIYGSGIIVYRINTSEKSNFTGAPYIAYVFRPGDTRDGKGFEQAGGDLDCSFLSAESGRVSYGSAVATDGLSENAITYTDGTNSGIVIKNVGSAAGETISFDIEFHAVQTGAFWDTVMDETGSASYHLLDKTWTKLSVMPADYANMQAKTVTYGGAIYMAYQNRNMELCLAKYQGGAWSKVYTSPRMAAEFDVAADDAGISLVYNGEGYNGVYLMRYTAGGVREQTVREPESGAITMGMAKNWVANPQVTSVNGTVAVVYRKGYDANKLVVSLLTEQGWEELDQDYSGDTFLLRGDGTTLYLLVREADGLSLYQKNVTETAGFSSLGYAYEGGNSVYCDLCIVQGRPYVACVTSTQLSVYERKDGAWSRLGNPVAQGYLSEPVLSWDGENLYAFYRCQDGQTRSYVKKYELPSENPSNPPSENPSNPPSETPSNPPAVTPPVSQGSVSLSGSAHVQTFGDRQGVWAKDTLTLGTTGQGKRLEAISITLNNTTGYSGGITYRVHRQTYGWTDWVQSGQQAGTTGQGKRLEAIELKLTGELAEHYSIRYRVHIQTYGWNQGWQYDGALAGTTGEAKRLEALEIQLVPRTETMGVTYRVHRQTYGWEKEWLKNGDVSGTVGQSKRLEGITLALTGNQYSGDIVYMTHVQTYGWQGKDNDLSTWAKNGEMSGTYGKAKRLEAIRINLTGEVAKHYDIYYRVHAQTYGWLNWAKNGEPAGTAGYAKRLEAIQVMLVPKGGAAPAKSYQGVTSKDERAYIMK